MFIHFYHEREILFIPVLSELVSKQINWYLPIHWGLDKVSLSKLKNKIVGKVMSQQMAF